MSPSSSLSGVIDVLPQTTLMTQLAPALKRELSDEGKNLFKQATTMDPTDLTDPSEEDDTRRRVGKKGKNEEEEEGEQQGERTRTRKRWGRLRRSARGRL